MDRTPSPHLVLVVDADPRFLDDARLLLTGQRVLTARSLDEAAEIVPGGRVDLVLLGPTHGTEEAFRAASGLAGSDPGIPMVAAANLITERMLLAAGRSGLSAVVPTPLTMRAVSDLLAHARRAQPAPEPVPVRLPEAPVVVVEFDAHSGLGSPAQFIPIEAMTPPAAASPMSPPVTPKTPPAPDPVLFAPDPDWDTATPRPTVPPATRPMVNYDPAAPVTHPVMPPVEHPPVPTGEPSSIGAPMSAPVVPATVPEIPNPASTWAETVPMVQPESEVWSRPGATTASPAPSWELPPIARPETVPRAEPLPGAPLRAGVGNPFDTLMPPPMPTTPPPTAAEDALVIHPERVGGIPTGSALPPPPPEPHRGGSGRVVAVMAGKGGSGKTITATNLAMALTIQRGADRVALIDADIQFGDVALLLQVEPTRTIVDVARRIDEMSEAKLDAMLLRHESGLRVLPAPVLPATQVEVPAKVVARIIDRMRGLYDIIVVDTPPIFDDHLVTLLEQADDVLVVVDMDLPSVKNAKIALDALRGSGFPMGRLQLVVNRVNAKARLDLVELERSLGLRVAGSIPSDRLIPQSVNEGIPVVALSPRSRVARAFHVLAGLIHTPTR